LDPGLIGTLLDRFGLPVAVLVVFATLILTGRLRAGSATEEEIEYRERLRMEEREARLAAEKRLADAIEANRALTEGFRELERSVLRDQRRDPPGTGQ
jgi:hypothetical protein